MDNLEEIEIAVGHVQKSLGEVTALKDQGHEYVSKLPLFFQEVEQLRAEYRVDQLRGQSGYDGCN